MAATLAVLLLAAGAVGFALSGDDSGDGSAGDGAAAAQGTTTGTLVEVGAEQLTLAPEDGGDHEVFAVRGRLDFVHLTEHVDEAWPVTVVWETVDGTRYAVRVDDA